MQRASEEAYAVVIEIFKKTKKIYRKNLDIWNTTLKENRMKLNKNKTVTKMVGARYEISNK